jgi:hypothetical protein
LLALLLLDTIYRVSKPTPRMVDGGNTDESIQEEEEEEEEEEVWYDCVSRSSSSSSSSSLISQQQHDSPEAVAACKRRPKQNGEDLFSVERDAEVTQESLSVPIRASPKALPSMRITTASSSASVITVRHGMLPTLKRMGIHSGPVRPLTRTTIPPPLNITTLRTKESSCQDLEEDWIQETDNGGTVGNRSQQRLRENRSCGSLPERWCRHGSNPNQERYSKGRKNRKGSKKTREMIDKGVETFNRMQEDEDNRRANYYADRYEGY